MLFFFFFSPIIYLLQTLSDVFYSGVLSGFFAPSLIARAYGRN